MTKKQMSKILSPKYIYNAVLDYVYDGDSYTLDIDLGLNIWVKNQKIRLMGYNTPELRGVERPEGLKVRDFVREILPEKIIIRTHKDRTGKYGRWLAEVFFDNAEGEQLSLGPFLHSKGFAEVYPAKKS